eukprot:scaffold902_cov254-Ochromonas_danica.AAC.3
MSAEEHLHLPNQKRGKKLIISTYETDMFRVVAKPIIETIDCIWKESLEDIWLIAIFGQLIARRFLLFSLIFFYHEIQRSEITETNNIVAVSGASTGRLNSWRYSC